MAKQRLRKSHVVKSDARRRAAQPESSSSKGQSNTAVVDDDSVITFPLEATSPPAPKSPPSVIHQDPEDGYGEIEVFHDVDDVSSTITNEFSTCHHDGRSDGGKEASSHRSFVRSSQRDSQSNHGHGSRICQNRTEARQSSLLDAVSTEETESVRREEPMVNRQSCRIKQQLSHTSNQSWTSRLSTSPDQEAMPKKEEDDESSSWAGSTVPASIAKTASAQSNTPDKLHIVTSNATKAYGSQNEGGLNGDPMEGNLTDDQLGPSWYTESVQKNISNISSTSSTTSSVAMVRMKWRARRRTDRRNARFHVEEDWCTKDENVDWPGAAPHPRILSTAIPEEEDEETSRTLPREAPKRSGLCSFFACWYS